MGRRAMITARVVVVGFGAIALGATLGMNWGQEQQAPSLSGYVAPVDVDTASLPGPTQPVFFRHDIHAGQYGIDCQFCHSTVEIASTPGIPPMSTCASCHQYVLGNGNPEIAKVMEAVSAGEAIQWEEIHDLPQHAHFPHYRHVNAGVTCQECHGPVETMPQVYLYSPLKMGWCLDCHKSREVTTDCTACHY